MMYMRSALGPHVLIVVQNLPVPLDRRVWLECQALVEAGYRVSVICPSGPGDPASEEIDGVRIQRYGPAPPAHGLVGYLWEFSYCWLRTAWLAEQIWRREPFDVLQACNPPDTYWALALLYRAPLRRHRTAKFTYDQHDLSPEVYRSRFGEPTDLGQRIQLRILYWLERCTYRLADQVIATNHSYRTIAINRGRCRPEGVTVVRSGPHTGRMRPVDGLPELRRGRSHLLVYLGVMGPQDGVDVALRAMQLLLTAHGRTDVHLALLGFGDCYQDLAQLVRELGLEEYVTFTGRADARMITEYLSTADVGLSPDPLNPLNDVSTMNKTMEYLSFALPVVTFDLTEARVSAGDAAVYVDPSGTPDEAVYRFADAINALIDDPDRRVRMAVAGRRRAETVLDWQPQRRAYVAVYDRVLNFTSTPPPAPEAASADGTDEWGHRMINVIDTDELRAFARLRSRPHASES
jgi:glycosyltransferase involved in cell wall biosynthesis